MKPLYVGDKVKFITKDDGNIKYGLEGVVTEVAVDWNYAASIEVKFKRAGVWTVSDYELKHLPTVAKKKKKT